MQIGKTFTFIKYMVSGNATRLKSKNKSGA
jgi:hypothetical protein